jgi:hypothetical protein
MGWPRWLLRLIDDKHACEQSICIKFAEFFLNLDLSGKVSWMVRIRHLGSQNFVIAAYLQKQLGNQLPAAQRLVLLASIPNEKYVSSHLHCSC